MPLKLRDAEKFCYDSCDGAPDGGHAKECRLWEFLNVFGEPVIEEVE